MSATFVFIILAVVLNSLIYGGVYAIYAAEQRRVDPPPVRTTPTASPFAEEGRQVRASVAARASVREAA